MWTASSMSARASTVVPRQERTLTSSVVIWTRPQLRTRMMSAKTVAQMPAIANDSVNEASHTRGSTNAAAPKYR